MESRSDQFFIRPPSIATPKGGGAIRGVGEKVTTNAATGTAAFSVPIHTSPGRDGFGPSLLLSYGSGSGNTAFGLGWDLGVPSIARKTDRGLPRYHDADDSDVFMLADSEDLVPADVAEVVRDGYRVRRYRPRVEGPYARIERWSRPGDVHWRTTSATNTTTIYGRTDDSRIVDPTDVTRVFRWLACESSDGKGNLVVYRYARETGAGVDTTRVHERNRADARGTQRYLERIYYGNRQPDVAGEWMFEVGLDYALRADPFSTYRAGFEVRTYRRCERISMYHRFPELGADPVRVHSTELIYDDAPTGARLSRIAERGHAGSVTRSLPPLDFAYSSARIDDRVRDAAVDALPAGVDDVSYRWLDLDGEGLSGVLAEQGSAWLYQRNRGGAFGPTEVVAAMPAASVTSHQFVDLDGDGRLDVVAFDGAAPGYFARTADGWQPFVRFDRIPNTPISGPNARIVDLTGDGHGDLLVTEADVFAWYPSLGVRGFADGHRLGQALDEERGPRLVFADGTQSMFLADMSGDGLVDLVRVRNGEVCYWPNLGYARFGAKVTLDRSPVFDTPDHFDPRRVRFADVDGSGTTDFIYVGADEVLVYANECGNGFASPRTIAAPPFDSTTTVATVDLFGTGTACLVWSSPGARGVRYVDLAGGVKPNLLITIDNNRGMTTTIDYAPSTKFYLADRRAGTPWRTRLPFPVHCVERIHVRDRWRETTFATSYSYHHGYYDGHERELRGFARVEQVDIESFAATGPYVTADRTLWQAPVKTVTWYETGGVERTTLANEYTRLAGEHTLPPVIHEPVVDVEEWREAIRSCKGRIVRQEVFELDRETLAPIRLFTTATHTHRVRRLQPRGRNLHAVYAADEVEAITYHHDLVLGEVPDPRVHHVLNLRIDDYGNVVAAATVTYPRRGIDPTAPPEAVALQAERHVAYVEQRFTAPVDDATGYRTPLACEAQTFEITGVVPAGDVFTADELRGYAFTPRFPAPRAVTAREYHAQPVVGPAARIVDHTRTLFCDDTLASPRAFGESGPRGLVYEVYKLALTDGLVTAVFGSRVPRAELTRRGGYVALAPGEYWARSGTVERDPLRFCLPTAYVDPFGNRTTVAYAHDLLVAEITDAVLNTTRVTFDYRVLAPNRVIDVNDNVTTVLHDALGHVIAVANVDRGDALPAGDAMLADAISYFESPHLDSVVTTLLGAATARHLYTFGERIAADGTIVWGANPSGAVTMRRERHVDDGPGGWFVDVEYSDGAGNLVIKKTRAEPAPGTTAPRWLASGKTVVNNKGKPVKQYEPYFSASEHRFEEPVEVGVTPLLYYDALGRMIRTDAPDGSYTRVVHSPWHIVSYDPNDTLEEPGNRWLTARTGAGATLEDARAAAGARVHANTPGVTYLDSLGRTVVAVEIERHRYPGEAVSIDTRLVTVTTLDAEGRPLWIEDARGNLVKQFVTPPRPAAGGFTPAYDIAGAVLFEHGMDAGGRWLLNDATGKPLFAWDANERAGVVEQRFATTKYDATHRPIESWLAIDGGAPILVERRQYGEGVPGDRSRNLRGQLFVHEDPSGRMTAERYDDGGRVLEATRVLIADHRSAVVDWQTAAVAAERFTKLTSYDAIGRVVRELDWHRAGAPVTVLEPAYNERGLVTREDMITRATRQTAAPGYSDVGATRSTVIEQITYDAKGQRTLVLLGNGTRTRLVYDPQTFRLTQQRTTRPNYDPAFPSAIAQYKTADVVQNLFYTYDAKGNVTEIYDDALRPAFFANAVIEPTARYTYDSLDRLISATGREHVAAVAPTFSESGPQSRTFPVPAGDPADQRNYVERYRYDLVGNLVELVHSSTTSWTRSYEYAPTSNRLVSTTVGATTTSYPHDTHGNILAFANIATADRLVWDHRDMIHVLPRGGGGRVYYQYAADKQRTRKVSETQTGAVAYERIYLGSMELYRRFGAGGVVVEEIETHHVAAAGGRVLIVEDVLATDTAQPLGPRRRFQYANHLGSVSLELDAAGGVITYEEYHPYGTTAYRFAASQTDTKRYRFTGMERDEESGLGYHTARYYAPWLARWASADPAGVADGLNVYLGMQANPIKFHDRSGRAAADFADWWERQVAPNRPNGSGEMQAAERAAQIQRGSEWLVDHLPGGTSPTMEYVREQLVTGITVGKLVVDVASGLAAAVDDPAMIARGILRLGTGTAEGVNDWERGDKVGGGSKITIEALSALLIVLGGVSAARAAALPRNPNLPGGITNAGNRAFYQQFEGAAAETGASPLSTQATQVTIQPLVEAPAGEIGPQLHPARYRLVNGVRQVTTSGGTPLRFRIDAVFRNLLTDWLTWEEAKSTVTAPFTKSQAAGFPLFERFGGIVRAHNAGAVGLPYGSVLGPQGAITVLRPIDLIIRLVRPSAEAGAGVTAADANRDARR